MASYSKKLSLIDFYLFLKHASKSVCVSVALSFCPLIFRLAY